MLFAPAARATSSERLDQEARRVLALVAAVPDRADHVDDEARRQGIALVSLASPPSGRHELPAGGAANPKAPLQMMLSVVFADGKFRLDAMEGIVEFEASRFDFFSRPTEASHPDGVVYEASGSTSRQTSGGVDDRIADEPR